MPGFEGKVEWPESSPEVASLAVDVRMACRWKLSDSNSQGGNFRSRAGRQCGRNMSNWITNPNI